MSVAGSCGQQFSVWRSLATLNITKIHVWSTIRYVVYRSKSTQVSTLVLNSKALKVVCWSHDFKIFTRL